MILDYLKSIDRELFLLLNGCHSDFFDILMFYISKGLTWTPVFLLMAFIIIKKHKINAISVLLFTALLITTSDQVSVQLFKNVFMRLRPCHEPSLSGLVHIVNNHCGGKFGFISSHATNYFALALYFIVVSGINSLWFRVYLLLWAGLIAYSRIYLGVHYPADVAAGAVVGSLIGLGWGYIALLFVKKIKQKTLSASEKNKPPQT